MALPASGTISFNDIQTEFGGSNPIGLEEYYRTGTPGFNTSIPTSGQIAISNFYSTQAVQITDNSFYSLNPDPAYATFFVTSGGKIQFSAEDNGATPQDIESWYGGVGSGITSYEVKVDVTSGTVLGDSTGAWLALSGGTRSWYVVTQFPFDSQVASFTVSLRRTGGSVLDTASITIQADSF
jgi:hypothetical protein